MCIRSITSVQWRAEQDKCILTIRQILEICIDKFEPVFSSMGKLNHVDLFHKWRA